MGLRSGPKSPLSQFAHSYVASFHHGTSPKDPAHLPKGGVSLGAGLVQALPPTVAALSFRSVAVIRGTSATRSCERLFLAA